MRKKEESPQKIQIITNKDEMHRLNQMFYRDSKVTVDVAGLGQIEFIDEAPASPSVTGSERGA